MKIEFYAVKDIKMQHFMQPFASPGLVSTMRNMTVALKDDKSMLRQFPMDYELWKISSFDDKSGGMEPTLEYVCQISEIINQKEG